MYTKVTDILKMAEAANTAAIAFVCVDYISARAVAQAAEISKTPAIIMLYPEHATIQRACGFAGYASSAKELADEVSVPVGLHLDHCFKAEAIIHAINCGFESVMMDASEYELNKNISMTRELVQKAHKMGASVEGEIGRIGAANVGDDTNEDFHTSAEAAEIFAKESGVDSLAISIGNAHGAYKNPPKLNIKRLEEIKERVNIPLVLHGGSGIPDDQLIIAFSKGIRKFNLGTDYLGKYYRAVSSFVKENDNNPDPVKIIDLPNYAASQVTPYLVERLTTLCKFNS
jgi:ketose-bisphosphate aldolase